jgi:hypothetical protein
MNRFLSLAGAVLALFLLLPGQAYSRGGGGRQNDQENDRPTPTPAPTPAAAVPVQGIISEVTPFAVSIKTSPLTTALSYKVSRDTPITLNGKTVTVADLKPGMLATVTPARDNVYADSIVASIPAAEPPAGSSVPPDAQASVPVPQAPASSSSSSSYSPFGRQSMP